MEKEQNTRGNYNEMRMGLIVVGSFNSGWQPALIKMCLFLWSDNIQQIQYQHHSGKLKPFKKNTKL